MKRIRIYAPDCHNQKFYENILSFVGFEITKPYEIVKDENNDGVFKEFFQEETQEASKVILPDFPDRKMVNSPQVSPRDLLDFEKIIKNFVLEETKRVQKRLERLENPIKEYGPVTNCLNELQRPPTGEEFLSLVREFSDYKEDLRKRGYVEAERFYELKERIEKLEGVELKRRN